MECLLWGGGEMLVLLFLAKASGFVLKEPDTVFAVQCGWGVIGRTCQGFRPLGATWGSEFLRRHVSGDSTGQVVPSALSPGAARIPCPICHPMQSCQQLKVLSTKPLTLKANFLLIFFKKQLHENINTQHLSKQVLAFKYNTMLNYVMWCIDMLNFTDQMLPMTFPHPDKDVKILLIRED